MNKHSNKQTIYNYISICKYVSFKAHVINSTKQYEFFHKVLVPQKDESCTSKDQKNEAC